MVKKSFYFSILVGLLFAACNNGGDDDESNALPPSGSLDPALIGDWLFTYQSTSEQELWSWNFEADGSMGSCRWEADANGTNPSPQLCLRGGWSDVGSATHIWPILSKMSEQYPEFGFSAARVILTTVDSTASKLRWQPGWLLSTKGDTMTYLGDVMPWAGGPQMYGDAWTVDGDSFTLQEDGTCDMVMNGEVCDCAWENSEGGRTTLSCTNNENGGSSTRYLQGYFGLYGGILYILDLEDPAHFIRQ